MKLKFDGEFLYRSGPELARRVGRSADALPDFREFQLLIAAELDQLSRFFIQLLQRGSDD